MEDTQRKPPAHFTQQFDTTFEPHYSVLIAANDVPEPATLSLVGLTLVGAFLASRGRRKDRKQSRQHP